MKVCLTPLPKGNRAMYRVAGALSFHAPIGVEFVDRPENADVQVLHVVGRESLANIRCDRYIVIQYCYRSAADTGPDPEAWAETWGAAEFVWSYYDLHDAMPAGARFMEAPLGVDRAFLRPGLDGVRSGVVTSGFVSSPEAEAIEEVAIAAAAVGMPVFHLGPRKIDGIDGDLPGNWSSRNGISDDLLARIYGRSLWVSGLRHVEGFELPAAEGLICGARPFMFDRPETRRWYDGLAEFVPGCSGAPLVEILTELFSRPRRPVSPAERTEALQRFSWSKIAGEFWKRLGSRNIASKRRSLARGAGGRWGEPRSVLGHIPARGWPIPGRAEAL